MLQTAAIFFPLAANGGAFMSRGCKWRQRMWPVWLVIAHAALAAIGVLLLLLAAFGWG